MSLQSHRRSTRYIYKARVILREYVCIDISRKSKSLRYTKERIKALFAKTGLTRVIPHHRDL